MPAAFATHRTPRERVRRVARRPIQAIRESFSNRRERDWNNYYAAAKMTGQSETNARLFADQIVGRKIPSLITREVKSFLKPLVKKIVERQNVKSKILKLVAQNGELAKQSLRPHLSSRARAEIRKKQDENAEQINILTHERLPGIEYEINAIQHKANNK